MPRIRITAGAVSLEGVLADTACGRAIAGALPLERPASLWGEEIYFDVGVEAELDETAAEVVEAGALGYWPTGRALCLFFGPTPASRGDEIRPASAVCVVGRLEGDLTPLETVRDGDPVRVELAG